MAFYCYTHNRKYHHECPQCQADERDAEERAQQAEDTERAIRDAAFDHANPGNYECPGCGYITLKYRKSRCPKCQFVIENDYWDQVDEAERVRKERAAARQAEAERNQAGAQTNPDNAGGLVGPLLVLIFGFLVLASLFQSPHSPSSSPSPPPQSALPPPSSPAEKTEVKTQKPAVDPSSPPQRVLNSAPISGSRAPSEQCVLYVQKFATGAEGIFLSLRAKPGPDGDCKLISPEVTDTYLVDDRGQSYPLTSNSARYDLPYSAEPRLDYRLVTDEYDFELVFIPLTARVERLDLHLSNYPQVEVIH